MDRSPDNNTATWFGDIAPHGPPPSPKVDTRPRCPQCGRLPRHEFGCKSKVPTCVRSPRGFAAMTVEARRAIAKKGGIAVHVYGKGHEFTADEARAAGRKGGGVAGRRARELAEQRAHRPPPLRAWEKVPSFREGRWFYRRQLDSTPTVVVATIIDMRNSDDDTEPTPWSADVTTADRYHATAEKAMAAVDAALVAEGWTLR